MMKRDGWSFTRITQEAQREYVENHWGGNPQTLMDKHLPQSPRDKWLRCPHHVYYYKGVGWKTEHWCGKRKKEVGSNYELCRKCEAYLKELKEVNQK